MFLFFFFKQKTAYEVRISDWSSDVCSSDLGTPSLMPPETVAALIAESDALWGLADDVEITLEANPNSVEVANFADLAAAGVNRVSINLKAGVLGKSVSVRVDIGGCSILSQ